MKRKERHEWDSGVMGIFQRIVVYLGSEQDYFLLLSEEIQVPMFWSGDAG